MFKPNANVIRELDLPPEPEKEREGGGGLLGDDVRSGRERGCKLR